MVDRKHGFAMGLVVGLGVTAALMLVWPSGKEVPKAQWVTPQEPTPAPSLQDASVIAKSRLGIDPAAGIEAGRRLLAKLRRAGNKAEKMRLIDEIGHRRYRGAVAHLRELVDTERGTLRLEAIEALGRIGDELATDVLIGLTEAALPRVRSAAVQALRRSGNEESGMWLKDLAHSDLLGLGSEALLAMGRIGDEGVEPYLEEMMGSPKTEIAESAAQALAELASPTARRTLIQAASRRGSGRVRLAAISGLASFDDETTTRLLSKWVIHQHPKVATAAIRSLALRGGDDVVTLLSEVAHEGRRRLRKAATRGLALVGSPEARDELINLLFNDDPLTGPTAAFALARSGDDESLDALIGAMDGGPGLAHAALNAMASAPTAPRVIKALLLALTGRGQRLKTLAAEGLAIHLGPDAVHPLKQALRRVGASEQAGLCHVLAGIDGDASRNSLVEMVRGGRETLQIDALEALVNEQRLSTELARSLALGQLERSRGKIRHNRVVKILASLEDEEANQALILVAKKMPNTRLSSLFKVMGAQGNEGLMLGLVQLTKTEPSPQRRLALIEALGGSSRPEVRVYLRELASGTGEEANKALASFEWEAPHEVQDIAFAATQSEEWSRRVVASSLLGRIDTPEAISELARLLDDAHPRVKLDAMMNLTSSESPEALDAVVDAYARGNDGARDWGASFLASSGHPEALGLLVDAVKHGDDEHIMDAYWAIETIGTPASQAALTDIRETAPADHEELQALLENSRLEEEEQELRQILDQFVQGYRDL